MPVPRRFDRRMPERDQTRINERIGVREVRLVDEDGKQIGVIDTKKALAMAQDRDLDLVEVAPDSRPPVARLLDYSKYKYEQEQKAKQARKHQQQINVREIKLRPKIADHDYMTKKGHVERFLKQGDKVKVTIMFRGREQAHPERGRNLLQRLFEDLDGLGVVEQNPLQEGRNMHMLVAPSKEALKERDKAKTGEQPAVEESSAGSGSEAADADEPSAGSGSEAADAEEPSAGSGSDAPEADEPAANEVPDPTVAAGEPAPEPEAEAAPEAAPEPESATK
ncbi:MAG TPA: translation initiation factor IF-3 [Solirubrobacterales bacterium]|nr:translation initiation factor IF-3 [Solirubrobacterales bacterium]